MEQAKICTEVVFDALEHMLTESSDDVIIYGFGTFKRRTVRAHAARHPSTKELITIPEHSTISFKPCERIYNILQQQLLEDK